jgi:MscS family membrane protein
MWTDIQDKSIELWADPRMRAGAILIGSFLTAYIVEFLFRRIFMALASKTKTDLDDKILAALRRPIFWSVIFVGLAWVVSIQVTSGQFVIYGVLKTLALFLWTMAAIRVGDALLTSAAQRGRPQGLIQDRTKPIFDMAVKLVFISMALYFALLAWDVNVSAWLASAGIIGIAVGFAAQDTLANLIAGIAILADGIYKVGDFVVLDSQGGLRGKVTRIGMRSTRILTLDNVEITVPNDMIGKSKVINEVGGPHVRQRIRANVSAAYGSDVDQVFEVLGSCADGVDGVSPDPAPRVRFREFGGSGLEFDLLVWITEPSRRDFIISDLNVRIYKAFDAAGIEIPYSKHDVYIKQMPGTEPA